MRIEQLEEGMRKKGQCTYFGLSPPFLSFLDLPAPFSASKPDCYLFQAVWFAIQRSITDLDLLDRETAKMQTYDIIMLIVLGITTFMGAIKGFAWQMASLASIVVSYFVAYTFRNDVARMIKAQEPWNGFLAMLFLYAGTSFVIWVVFRMLSGAIDRMRLRDFDRHMGALLDWGRGTAVPVDHPVCGDLARPRQQQSIVDSRSGSYISRFLAATDGIVWPKEVEQIVRPYLDRLEERLEQRGSTAQAATPATPWGSGFSDPNWQMPTGRPVVAPNPEAIGRRV